MVQISPLVRAIPVLSYLATTGSASDVNGLAVRQTFDPSDLPTACQSPCQVVNTMDNCGSSLSCMCTSSIGNQLQQCMSCLASNVPSVKSEAQSSLDSWNEGCNGNLSLSGGSSSSGSTSSSGGSSSGGSTTSSNGGSSSGSSSGGSSSGGTVPAPSSGGSSSSGSSSPFSTKSGGAVGFATCSMAVCVVAAVAGAFVSF